MQELTAVAEMAVAEKTFGQSPLTANDGSPDVTKSKALHAARRPVNGLAAIPYWGARVCPQSAPQRHRPGATLTEHYVCGANTRSESRCGGSHTRSHKQTTQKTVSPTPRVRTLFRASALVQGSGPVVAKSLEK